MWALSGAVKIGFASRIRLEVSEFLDESLLKGELRSSKRRIADEIDFPFLTETLQGELKCFQLIISNQLGVCG